MSTISWNDLAEGLYTVRIGEHTFKCDTMRDAYSHIIEYFVTLQGRVTDPGEIAWYVSITEKVPF